MSKHVAYIGKIVKMYMTRNENYFCREENQSLNDQPVKWPIFIPKAIGDKIESLPIYGIITKEENPRFFNGKSRLTCRLVNHDKKELEKLINESENLDKEIDKAIIKKISDLEKK